MEVVFKSRKQRLKKLKYSDHLFELLEHESGSDDNSEIEQTSKPKSELQQERQGPTQTSTLYEQLTNSDNHVFSSDPNNYDTYEDSVMLSNTNSQNSRLSLDPDDEENDPKLMMNHLKMSVAAQQSRKFIKEIENDTRRRSCIIET